MPQVNFRVSSERLAVIDHAAAIRGVFRTEFVLRSSEAAAIEILNEHPVIAFDVGPYQPGRRGDVQNVWSVTIHRWSRQNRGWRSGAGNSDCFRCLAG